MKYHKLYESWQQFNEEEGGGNAIPANATHDEAVEMIWAAWDGASKGIGSDEWLWKELNALARKKQALKDAEEIEMSPWTETNLGKFNLEEVDKIKWDLVQRQMAFVEKSKKRMGEQDVEGEEPMGTEADIDGAEHDPRDTDKEIGDLVKARLIDLGYNV